MRKPCQGGLSLGNSRLTRALDPAILKAMTVRTLIPLLPAILVSGLLSTAAVAEEVDLLALEAAYVKALEEAAQPRRALLERYRDSLRAHARRAQEAGSLEETLAATRELENAEAEGERDFSRLPELARLRGIYETNAAALEKEEREARLRLHAAYLERLRSGIEGLTRRGRVEDAVSLNEKRRRLEEIIEEESAFMDAGGAGGGEGAGDASGLNVLWELRSRASGESVNDCEIRSDGDRLVLSTTRGGGRSWYRSRREFRPPFRIDARVATDSTNVRLYYIGNLAILNWEMNPSELRLHKPNTAVSVGVPGKGQIAVIEMHDVEVDVLADRVVLRVNGEFRGELEADNAALRGPVGIGPGFGSVVTVERFRVLALE